MSNLKIDQEEFNRKAQHILDTVVRPQVERYEKAKAEQKNKMTAVEYIEYMWTLQGAIYKNDIDKALEMEKEQMKDAFVECWKANIPDGIECKLDAEQYYNETFKSK